MTNHPEPLGAEEAARLGLPCIIWKTGLYRLVLWRDDEDGTLRRTPERLLGHDLLLGERWGLLGERTWDEARGEYVVAADWQYLALQMADQVPLPAETAEEASALDQAAEDRSRTSPRLMSEGAYALYQNVEQDEHTAFLSCVPCGCTITSTEDGRALAASAFERGWRTRTDGRALCPDCAAAERGETLATAVQEDEGRPYLICGECRDMLGSAIDAHALIERAHKDGWRTFIGWDAQKGRADRTFALCPDCAAAHIP